MISGQRHYVKCLNISRIRRNDVCMYMHMFILEDQTVKSMQGALSASTILSSY